MLYCNNPVCLLWKVKPISIVLKTLYCLPDSLQQSESRTITANHVNWNLKIPSKWISVSFVAAQLVKNASRKLCSSILNNFNLLVNSRIFLSLKECKELKKKKESAAKFVHYVIENLLLTGNCAIHSNKLMLRILH